MNKIRSNGGYVPALDGIRAIAILLVLGLHAGMPFMVGGYIGVDIFFFLSGFLITTLLIREYATKHRINLKNFYVRRILRLLPALIFFLLVFNLYEIFFLKIAQDSITQTTYALFYVGNWVRAFNISQMGLLGQTWSLSTEEQFYFLWPITFILLLRLRLSITKIGLIVVVLAGMSWALRAYLLYKGASFERVYYALDTRADGLLLGCALALFLSNSGTWLNNLVKIVNAYGRYAVLVVIAFIALVVWHAHQHQERVYYWFLTGVNLSSGILTLVILQSERSFLRSILEWKVLVWLGRISYGIYLWHFVIYFSMIYGLHSSWVLTFVVGTPLTLFAAGVSYYFVEQPILKLKTKFQPVYIETPVPMPQIVANTE